ncbi:unnamed protein product [Protopolystoma xenopodis]|uniref:Uncharacterized protein n=1 Tax=Protopolystoma xenopodis TaxID=117903 RepID=A0A3S5CN64_9PLAT|nr:unnamed protein product [Protopolystoma xenopodis]
MTESDLLRDTRGRGADSGLRRPGTGRPVLMAETTSRMGEAEAGRLRPDCFQEVVEFSRAEPGLKPAVVAARRQTRLNSVLDGLMKIRLQERERDRKIDEVRESRHSRNAINIGDESTSINRQHQIGST